MEQVKIGEAIRELRRKRNIAQDILAQALDVSVQAVSKWETGASLPDILLLPEIARFFGVSIDQLYYGILETVPAPDGVTDDGKLRIVQFLGVRCLGAEEWQAGETIQLDVEKLNGWLKKEGRQLPTEIWGNAAIKGDIIGALDAGGDVVCKGINGCVDAGGNVACAGVNGNVNAGDGVICGNVRGNVSATEDIHCASIEGDGAVRCETLYCKGDIRCKTIEGEIHHEGHIDFPD
jgi:transcriptional regulator with XRE-family HTH domain